MISHLLFIEWDWVKYFMQTGHYDNMNLKDKGSCQEIEVLQNSPNFFLYVFVMN